MAITTAPSQDSMHGEDEKDMNSHFLSIFHISLLFLQAILHVKHFRK